MTTQQKVKTQKRKNKTKVFLNFSYRDVFIGEIQNDIFRVYDEDNYHHSHSLGMDQIILASPELDYKIIRMKYKGKLYETTRTYFYNKAKRKSLYNMRDMKFLALDRFGLKRAEKWEKYMENLETAQQDIFKIFEEQRKSGENNNEYLNEWEETNAKISSR